MVGNLARVFSAVRHAAGRRCQFCAAVLGRQGEFPLCPDCRELLDTPCRRLLPRLRDLLRGPRSPGLLLPGLPPEQAPVVGHGFSRDIFRGAARYHPSSQIQPRPRAGTTPEPSDQSGLEPAWIGAPGLHPARAHAARQGPWPGLQSERGTCAHAGPGHRPGPDSRRIVQDPRHHGPVEPGPGRTAAQCCGRIRSCCGFVRAACAARR
jgi:hypothetical protein